jgi:hypothetical protein
VTGAPGFPQPVRRDGQNLIRLIVAAVRHLGVQYKTAFVLAHKLREAMSAEHRGKMLSGHVEIGGAYFGGYVKPENRKASRRPSSL